MYNKDKFVKQLRTKKWLPLYFTDFYVKYVQLNWKYIHVSCNYTLTFENNEANHVVDGKA